MFTIYPAIDLRGGKVVRLKEGDPARITSYSDDSAETAKRWLNAGATWLHVVNLDGAFGESNHANHAALESILKLGTRVQFGGGMRSLDSIEAALSLGVSRVILGTTAIEQPDIVRDALTRFGAERIAVGIDGFWEESMFQTENGRRRGRSRGRKDFQRSNGFFVEVPAE